MTGYVFSEKTIPVTTSYTDAKNRNFDGRRRSSINSIICNPSSAWCAAVEKRMDRSHARRTPVAGITSEKLMRLAGPDTAVDDTPGAVVRPRDLLSAIKPGRRGRGDTRTCDRVQRWRTLPGGQWGGGWSHRWKNAIESPVNAAIVV